MDGCISRQAAIEEISRFSGLLHNDTIARLQMAVKRLPTAQSEEQEAVYPNLNQEVTGIWYACGNCGCHLRMYPAPKFCQNCGRKVNWNDI